MTNCCNFDMKSICEQFNLQVKETDTGIQVEINPKDATKKESLQNLAKACKDFCGCC